MHPGPSGRSGVGRKGQRGRPPFVLTPGLLENQREFIAKGQLEVRGNDHFASADTDDLYKSIDDLVQKLDRMLRRRSRLNKVKRKDTHLVDIPVEIPKAV